MKNKHYIKLILATFLITILAAGCFSTSAYAAKEQFRKVTSAGVLDIDAPVAGQKGDYTATVVNQGVYKVVNIDYYEKSTDQLKSGADPFRYDTAYYVLVTLQTTQSYYFAHSADGDPTASVSCNNDSAMAVAIDRNQADRYVGIKYIFPKTEADPNASASEGGSSAPVIPAENLVDTVNITGAAKPMPGQYAQAAYLKTNDVRVQLSEAMWSTQSGTPLKESDRFQFGETYVLSFYLNVWSSYEFARDYSHPLATADKPMPAVAVTIDGAADVTVMPDYTKNAHMLYLKVAKIYKCDTPSTIPEIRLNNVTAPVAGQNPSYSCGMALEGYERAALNDSVTDKGFTWQAAGGESLTVNNSVFRPQTTYQAVIRLKAKQGFSFQTNGSGSASVSASVDGRTASVQGNASEVTVTCVFAQTGNLFLDNAAVTDLEAPIAGQTPDYTVSYAGTEYGPSSFGADNATSKNSISWYCEEDKKTITTNAKFESAKTYTAQILIDAKDGYEFRYRSGVIDITATVNGKKASGITSSYTNMVCLSYTFPKTQEHKCSPIKVDECKATCKEAGKKAHYFCPECGRFFEDSKCSIQIPDINTWGVIPKTEHTGGKATCTKKAICTVCNTPYGQLQPHTFSTGWDYKDEKGHAHKCKTCGAIDTLILHSDKTAKCGEMAKCTECKTEYGQILQHQWSKTPEYTSRKGHAYLCTICGEHDTVKEHTPGPAATAASSQNCTVCGYMIAPKTTHTHNLVRMDAINATCTVAGTKSYYYCESCNSIFSDSKGKTEIDDHDSVIIPATGHKESKWKSDAEMHWKECTVKNCGAVLEETKEEHTLGKNGKCEVCNYRTGSSGHKDKDDEAAPSAESSQSTDSGSDIGQDQTDPSAQNSNTAKDASGNTTIWIIIAVIAIVIALCSVGAVIYILLKNKKADLSEAE